MRSARTPRGRSQSDAARGHPQVKHENQVLVEILRRLTWREKVRYIDRLLIRALRRM